MKNYNPSAYYGHTLFELTAMEFYIAASLIVLSLLSLIAVAFIVILLPADYFSNDKREKLDYANSHPLIYYGLLIAKNLLGAVLLCAGIIMLVLPGQGLLTILVGLMLINFPGKYKLTRAIVNKKPVYKPINWLRNKFNRGPIFLASDS